MGLADAVPTDSMWLGEQVGRKVAQVLTEDMSAAGGLSAEMTRLLVEFADGGPPASYMFKRTKRGGEGSSKSLGLAREGLFYQELAAALGGVCALPGIVFAGGDQETGLSAVLMEDLSSGVQSGYFFGPGSPLNWDKNLRVVTRGWALSPANVTTMAFAAAAKLHAAFWQRTDLKDKAWLRGAAWLHGADQESWLEYQRRAAEAWATVKSAMLEGTTKVHWHAQVVACLDASMAKADWVGFQAELLRRPWTLVHGDFHPANMIIRPGPGGDAHGATVAVFDFEQVGLGSGPQDLGQYLISHCEPSVRADIERGAVREYYDLLCGANTAVAETLSWEACWAEYLHGGIGRWMWMLPALATMCPPTMVQYFHDQALAFIEAHGFDPTNIPMPRV